MTTKFKTILQQRRKQRDARRNFEATKHLRPEILRDIGVQHIGRQAFYR